MPLSVPALTKVYEDVIKPSLEEVGLEVRRSDLILETGPIMESIWTSIYESRFIVADLTGMNPNVFYEVGIADTIGAPVIPLTQEAPVFDRAHLRHVIYDTTEEGLAALAQKLKGMAQAELRNTPHWQR